MQEGQPGVEESLLELQRKQFTGTCIVRDLQQHEKIRIG